MSDDLPRTPEFFRQASEEEERFLYALGRLTVAWGDVELELYRVLCHYAGVRDEVGRALFSGSRAKAMMDFISNIAHNTALAAERQDNLRAVFEQIAHINTMRDRLVHHSTTSYSFRVPTARSLTNLARVNRTGRHFIYEVGSSDIEAMCQDLYLIEHHLQQHRVERQGGFAAYHEPADISSWRYRPLSPRSK